MKKIVLTLILLSFIPFIKVDALSCRNEEIARLKKLAANITTTYDYVENGSNVSFNITLLNLNKDLYLIDTTNNTVYNYTQDEITLHNYKDGLSVKYNVYPTNTNCREQLLYTIRINLPMYNIYYKDEVCKSVEDYSLCQKWSTQTLDYKTFVNKVSDYKDSLNKNNGNDNVIKEVDNSSLLHIIISLLVEYYYVILIVLIISSGITIIIKNKKDNIYN